MSRQFVVPMARCPLLLFLAAISSILGLLHASPGDADPIYRACVDHCEKTGCVGDKCSQHCNFTSGWSPVDGPWYLQEPLYLRWKQWDCLSDCRYHCMLAREEERNKLGLEPVKYHGKWSFQRVNGIQEPVSVALSALNLAVQFHGWVSFFILVNYKLPFRPNKKPYYEYTVLWHIYAIFSMNSWFWSAVFHSSGSVLLFPVAVTAALRLFLVTVLAAPHLFLMRSPMAPLLSG